MLTRDGMLKIADFGVARSLVDSITRVSMMSGKRPAEVPLMTS
jgi:hypothetical protein